MDMNNIKSIYDNSVGKEVKKIQDSNGNILWYKVPDGYRKVGYLESSGTQYIDTGWIPQFDDEMILRVMILRKELSTFFGADNFVTASSQTYDNYWRIFNTSGTKMGTIQKNVWLTCKYKNGEYSQSNISQNINRGNTQCEMTLYLFAMHDSAVTKGASRITLFSVKGKRLMIPVVRNSDEKPGMYDLVNDVFYTNAGTGEFTWGEL